MTIKEKASIVAGLKAARDLIQKAQGIVEELPEDTEYEYQITDLADDIATVSGKADSLADDIEGRCND